MANQITVQKLVNAPLEKVWDYWTRPEHIIHWNFASPDWHSPRAENDLRVGGKFSYNMAAKDGSMSFDFGGSYTNTKHLQQIDYTIGDGRKVSVTFSREGSGTQVTEVFEAEQVHSHELQRNGWQAILDNFAAYTEG